MSAKTPFHFTKYKEVVGYYGIWFNNRLLGVANKNKTDSGWEAVDSKIALKVRGDTRYEAAKALHQTLCTHPSERQFWWTAGTDDKGKPILCGGCNDCGKVLRGGATLD